MIFSKRTGGVRGGLPTWRMQQAGYRGCPRAWLQTIILLEPRSPAVVTGRCSQTQGETDEPPALDCEMEMLASKHQLKALHPVMCPEVRGV
ncbi:hypothetical protein AAFF_G00185750 [Aldrovandia affinis]|uniref:Uncharacterized protein n=1 Tax=Aldrovandia affinis TaxID=143900 RepID=A0AAD7RJT3_9TELE|nr:hypothetical protein AAFF_G00185750 [Aldrovandia affinis]